MAYGVDREGLGVTTASLPPGVRRHGAGLQATVKARGERSYLSFDLETPYAVMVADIEDERARLRLLMKDRPRAGTLMIDAKRYLQLPSVRALSDYAQREQHILEWCALLGSKRRRSSGWPEAIEAQRDRWLTEPRAAATDGTVIDGPYAAASVNKRLRALSNLWTKLDGRRAPNPVLEVNECEEPDPEPRGLPYELIEAILAAIPGTRRKVDDAQIAEIRARAPRETAVSLARAFGISDTRVRRIARGAGTRSTSPERQNQARLRVIAYTGIPHEILKQLTRESVTFFPRDAKGQETGGTVLMPPRKKGKKRRRAQDKPLPELLPLIPQAAAAFREFDRLDCWGAFSNSSMWKLFRRACAVLATKDTTMRAALEGVSPYWFRHSYLTAVYDETKDLRVTGKIGGHRSERTTKRYTMAAVAPHVAAAAARLAARFMPTLPPALAPVSGARDEKQRDIS